MTTQSDENLTGVLVWLSGVVLLPFLFLGTGTLAHAQSPAFMQDGCSSVGQTYFRDFNARTDMTYNGQRTDGTHAINGRIFLETRFEDFACSYERNGQRMVEFFAEGRQQNASLPSGSDPSGANVVRVRDVASNDVLNVRSGPGINNRVVGALSNGDQVRRLYCQMQGRSEWCQIEMMTDMRERGWVNARYLTDGFVQGGAAHLPATPGTSGTIVPVRGLSSGGVLNLRSGPGTNYRVVGALINGDRVRNLGCQRQGNSSWCEIEMLTDMRERGWVSARYLMDQSGGATQRPSASRMRHIRFAAGTSGTEFTDELEPGTSVTYILGARSGQNLFFLLATNRPGMTWRLYNPDGSFLDQGTSSKEYRGELWQSGDHKIEVMNQSDRAQSYNVIFGIR